MNAIGYVRVSRADQANEGLSMEGQEARIRDYCARRGFGLVNVLVEDGGETAAGRKRGQSARKTRLAARVAGRTLLETLANGGATAVIVVKIDRLFRITSDALDTVDGWTQAGIAMHVLDFGGNVLDTSSAIGRAVFAMMAVFAQLEADMTGERTRAALAVKKARGERLGRPRRDEDMEALALAEEVRGTFRLMKSQGHESARSWELARDWLNESGPLRPDGNGGAKWTVAALRDWASIGKDTTR